MFAYGKSLFLVIDLRVGLIAKVWLLKTWICAWYWYWCMIT